MPKQLLINMYSDEITHGLCGLVKREASVDVVLQKDMRRQQFLQNKNMADAIFRLIAFMDGNIFQRDELSKLRVFKTVPRINTKIGSSNEVFLSCATYIRDAYGHKAETRLFGGNGYKETQFITNVNNAHVLGVQLNGQIIEITSDAVHHLFLIGLDLCN